MTEVGVWRALPQLAVVRLGGVVERLVKSWKSVHGFSLKVGLLRLIKLAIRRADMPASSPPHTCQRAHRRRQVRGQAADATR